MISALENIWMQVQKPGRYTGGEVNSTVKDKSSVSVRFALCYRTCTKWACPTSASKFCTS